MPALVLVASALAVKIFPSVHSPEEITVERIVTVALIPDMHSTTAPDRTADRPEPSAAERTWLETSFRKVTVKVGSEEELMSVYRQALEAGLLVHLVTDRGLTEFGGVPTRTCLAIGPDYDDLIDPVTGDLELY